MHDYFNGESGIPTPLAKKGPNGAKDLGMLKTNKPDPSLQTNL